MPLEHGELANRIRELETVRDSRVLVLAASQLEMELLPALYEQCRDLAPARRLDVVLHGRGGVVQAARRIALLLRAQAEQLCFIVPYHCESAATLLTLCGDDIIAGPLALFSPIDPLLNGADGTAFSALDIQCLGDMAQQWFGVPADEARQQALALLGGSVFPASLGAFYRSTLEQKQIGEQLLAFHLPGEDAAVRSRLIGQLMTGYHSHNYAITREEMAALGLRVRGDAAVERPAWEISRLLQGHVGGGQRASEDAPWCDALFATRYGASERRRHPGGLAPSWNVERYPR
ncbi:hypothetical protein GTP91_28780 [Rugamonas sp. FT82W]|uniref:Serine dehydrogenase proteinase n=1 Tax=Duganella vulcania TaxID=2692166 RepID=A0A845GE93_9BURK|nr:hypothetical protein [Duganella vulcania]MYM91157.1 hypothetical protein [Duganella vulcania]